MYLWFKVYWSDQNYLDAIGKFALGVALNVIGSNNHRILGNSLGVDETQQGISYSVVLYNEDQSLVRWHPSIVISWHNKLEHPFQNQILRVDTCEMKCDLLKILWNFWQQKSMQVLPFPFDHSSVHLMYDGFFCIISK